LHRQTAAAVSGGIVGPVIEAQMRNIWKREPSRHHSYVLRAATGVIAGLGALGYELALTAVARLIAEQAPR
jgi:3-dehydroquinate dehydratase II